MHAGHHVFAHVPHSHFFKLPEEVEHFYILAFVRTILTVTGGLFLPLFIYKETSSLTLVFLYMLLAQGVAKLPLRPFNLWVLKKCGVEWAMFLSIVLAGTEYALVYFLGTDLAAVFFYGFLEGFSVSLYWDAYHTSFGVFGRERDSAEEVAGLQVLQNVTSILLPLLSALIIRYVGFHGFYAIVFASTLLASIYLLFKFGKLHRVDFTFHDVLHTPYRELHVSDGIQCGFTWVIPIFLYIVFGGSVVLFGALKTAIGLAMALFSFVIARYFDRKRAFGLGKVPYLGNIVFTTLLTLFPTPVVVSVSEIARGITNTFAVAISATLYRVVKHRAPAMAVGRSFYVSVGKTVSFTIALIFAYLVESLHVLAVPPVDLTRYLILATIPFAITSVLLYGKLEKEVEGYA